MGYFPNKFLIESIDVDTTFTWERWEHYGDFELKMFKGETTEFTWAKWKPSNSFQPVENRVSYYKVALMLLCFSLKLAFYTLNKNKTNIQQCQIFYRVTVNLRNSVNWKQFIRPLSMDFTWLEIQISICWSTLA